MAGWLDGTVALVTGGGNGIGRAIVERYLSEGAKLGVLDRDAAAVDGLNSEFGPDVIALVGDVTSTDDTKRAVDAVVSAHGRLDAFVGNAAVFDYFARLESIECDTLVAAFDEIFSTNVKAYLIGARVAAPHLRANGGCMIFTVSNSGFYAGGGGVLYVASKHAVVGLVRQLAFELAPEVRVNGVAPGGTVTGLRGARSLGQEDRRLRDTVGLASSIEKATPLGIVADPSDHIGAYVLLASKQNSRAITGAIIHSDGGMEVRGGGRRQRSMEPRL